MTKHRFSYSPLLIILLSLAVTACAAMADFRKTLLIDSSLMYYAALARAYANGEGIRVSYAVRRADARAIALSILEAHQVIAVIEHPEHGRILATIEDPRPLLSPEPATMSIGVWILPLENNQTEIVVLSKARHLLALGRKIISEKEFHDAFAATLKQQATR